MTPEDLRTTALALPEAEENSHVGTTDFRVRNRIFATNPEPGRGVAKLTPEQQAMLIATEPAIFYRLPGGWGDKGWTGIDLAACDQTTLKSVLVMAWRNVAPKRLASAIAS